MVIYIDDLDHFWLYKQKHSAVLAINSKTIDLHVLWLQQFKIKTRVKNILFKKLSLLFILPQQISPLQKCFLIPTEGKDFHARYFVKYDERASPLAKLSRNFCE